MKRFWHIAAVFGLLISADSIESARSVETVQFFQSPQGEWVIGFPPEFDLEIDPQGNPLILAREGTVYMIHPETYIVENNWEIHPPSSLRFSPDKTKVLITPKEAPDTFSLLDWNTKRIILEEECKDKSISFLNNGRFVLKHDKKNETATIYDLQENSQFTVETKNIMQILEIQPAQRSMVGIYGVKEYDETRYYSEIKETFYHRWNYVNGVVLEHKLLADSRQYVATSARDQRNIQFMKSMYTADELIGVVTVMVSANVGDILYLWNTLTGKVEQRSKDDKLLYYGTPVEISADGQWLLNYGYPTWIISIPAIQQTGFIAYDDQFRMIDLVYDSPNNLLYLQGRSYEFIGIAVYDIKNKQYITEFPTVISPLMENEALFLFTNRLITSYPSGFVYQWDFENRSATYLPLPALSILPGPDSIRRVACFSPDDALAVGIADRSIKILNGALDTILHSLTVSETDDRYQAAFSPDGARLLVATGRESDPGTDNLIRIYETRNFEAVRDIRGHTDSVWYADFSPDGRRIVSASRDATAKVWDAETGAMVSDFVGHATGVVYARFFPDGRRVLSADNDHRAYIWDTNTARIEQTFDSIHLPARLSPDGHYLFAGTEVWDIAAGQIIKILDGAAKDLLCLALSPDGSMLLTSESEGLTKVWDVQEHILKPMGIEEFDMY